VPAQESTGGKGTTSAHRAPVTVSHEELFPKSSPPLATNIIAHIHHFRNRRIITGTHSSHIE